MSILVFPVVKQIQMSNVLRYQLSTYPHNQTKDALDKLAKATARGIEFTSIANMKAIMGELDIVEFKEDEDNELYKEIMKGEITQDNVVKAPHVLMDRKLTEEESETYAIESISALAKALCEYSLIGSVFCLTNQTALNKEVHNNIAFTLERAIGNAMWCQDGVKFEAGHINFMQCPHVLTNTGELAMCSLSICPRLEPLRQAFNVTKLKPTNKE